MINGRMNDFERYNIAEFGVSYPFGKGVAIHSIGDIHIFEYIPRVVQGCTVTMKLDNDRREFHILGASTSASTLDEAIACALAIKYEGCNSRAGYYFSAMLNGMKNAHKDWTYVQEHRND